jgi:hypothetical protein
LALEELVLLRLTVLTVQILYLAQLHQLVEVAAQTVVEVALVRTVVRAVVVVVIATLLVVQVIHQVQHHLKETTVRTVTTLTLIGEVAVEVLEP